MVRARPYPPTAILTLLQHGDADIEVVSVCSSNLGHRHVVSYEGQITLHGDGDIEGARHASLKCPVCDAPSGGLIIRRKGARIAPAVHLTDRQT
jgi:hypothetical protein